MDLQPYATNAFSVKVKPLNYSHPHTPSTMTYHGVTICVNSKVIGRIQSWNTQNAFNRKVTSVRELSAFTFGEPIDAVPGGSENDYTIDISRAEVWEQEFELACGYTSVWERLSDQDSPFTIMQYLMRGKKMYRAWMYTGCWFTGKNPGNPWESIGDGIVNISGSITYVNKSIVA